MSKPLRCVLQDFYGEVVREVMMCSPSTRIIVPVPLDPAVVARAVFYGAPPKRINDVYKAVSFDKEADVAYYQYSHTEDA